jgi:hypothetical protein
MHPHFFFPWFPGTLGVILLICCVLPYFLPTIIAFARNKDNAGGIFALNFFLGWTFIGWIASLIWALSANNRPTVIVNNTGPVYPQPPPSDYQHAARQTNPTLRPKSTTPQEKIDQLRQLKQLLDEGAITLEEFNSQKAAIL